MQKWESLLLNLELKEEEGLLTEEEKNEKWKAQLNLHDAILDEENFWSQKKNARR